MVRINSFAVSRTSRDALCDVLARTHAVLRTVDGYLQDRILEAPLDEGRFSIVSMIEFSGPEVIGRAVEAVAAYDREHGIDRKALTAQLGVSADMRLYSRLDL